MDEPASLPGFMATLALALAAGVTGWVIARSGEAEAAGKADANADAAAPKADSAAPGGALPASWPLVAPDPATIPEGPMGDAKEERR